MLAIGLIAEWGSGFLLGALVPRAGRKAELAMCTAAVAVVVGIAYWVSGLTPMQVAVLSGGWLSAAAGILGGKFVRFRLETRLLRHRGPACVDALLHYITVCDAFIRGECTREELDQAYESARRQVGRYARLASIAELAGEMRSICLMLAPDGLNAQEERLWLQVMAEATRVVRQLTVQTA